MTQKHIIHSTEYKGNTVTGVYRWYNSAKSNVQLVFGESTRFVNKACSSIKEKLHWDWERLRYGWVITPHLTFVWTWNSRFATKDNLQKWDS